MVEEGKFSFIGMSEPDSATLRRAHAVSFMVYRPVLSLKFSVGTGAPNRGCGDPAQSVGI